MTIAGTQETPKERDGFARDPCLHLNPGLSLPSHIEHEGAAARSGVCLEHAALRHRSDNR
jgi:hypothetical protein